jgi:deoxyribonuclease-4
MKESMKALGTGVERHDSIGQGLMDIKCFKRLMQDSRFDNMPIILETPNEELWTDEIKMLHSFE